MEYVRSFATDIFGRGTRDGGPVECTIIAPHLVSLEFNTSIGPSFDAACKVAYAGGNRKL